MKYSFTILLLFFTLLQACKNDKRTGEEPPSEDMQNNDRIPERDNVSVDEEYVADDGIYNPRNPQWYTYRYENEAITSENPVVRSNNNQEKSGAAAPEVYEITETSRPPLFDKNCLTAANPEACSNEAVIDWMRYAVERPKLTDQNQDVIHFVTFIINEKGQVENARIIPVQGQKICEPCQTATLEAVKGMATWLPAIRNGQAVKVRITLPVYYNKRMNS
ncbi:MAG: energy transducer TonB [Saprospiraceae bacterium]